MSHLGFASIIIPCYKQANYLYECLSSLLNQTDDQWEAIVVDDYSPDGDTIRKTINDINDSRIRVVRHEVNKGLAGARNTGARVATSDILAFVDSDDKLKPVFVERTLEYLHSHPEVDVVFGAFEFFGEKQKIGFRLTSDIDPLFQHLRYWVPGAGSVMRRYVWEAIGGYCEEDILRTGLEDREFWIASIAHQFVIIGLEEPLYYYRRYINSMSKRQSTQMHELHRFIVDRHPEVFGEKKLRHRYLAEGYLESTRAHYLQGNQTRALVLATCGLRYQWNHPVLRKYFLRAAVPPVLRSLRSRIMQISSQKQPD